MTETYVQPPLIDIAPLIAVTGETIQERFESFLEHNKWVLKSLEAMAEAWIAQGHRRLSVKMLFETLRYQYGVTVGDRFKLNNDYTSRFARLLLERHPDWGDYLVTRELRAA